MNVITISNMKGGVGKTILSATIGATLAAMDKKVCIVDLDPQAHLTNLFFKEYPSEYETSVQFFRYGERLIIKPFKLKHLGFVQHEITEKEYIKNIYENLHIIPSSPDVFKAFVIGFDISHDERIFVDRFMRTFANERFDYVIIDTPPEPFYTRVSFLVSDYLIIPIRMDRSLLDIEGCVKFITDIFATIYNKDYLPYIPLMSGRKLYLLGVVFNCVRTREGKVTTLKQLAKFLIERIKKKISTLEDITFTNYMYPVDKIVFENYIEENKTDLANAVVYGRATGVCPFINNFIAKKLDNRVKLVNEILERMKNVERG